MLNLLLYGAYLTFALTYIHTRIKKNLNIATIGHAYNYTITDYISIYFRQKRRW